MSASESTGERSRPPLLFRGFAPLIFLALLVVLLALLAPSVAPEHYVPATGGVTPTSAP